MTAADLERLDGLSAKTKELRAELSRLRNASVVSATNYSQTGGNGGTGDCVSRAVLSVMELEDEIQCNVLEMVEIIDKVPKAYTRLVMRLRYINGCSWGRIAAELGYTDSAAPYRLLLRYRNRIMSKPQESDNGMTMANGVK